MTSDGGESLLVMAYAALALAFVALTLSMYYVRKGEKKRVFKGLAYLTFFAGIPFAIVGVLKYDSGSSASTMMLVLILVIISVTSVGMLFTTFENRARRRAKRAVMHLYND